MSSVGDWVVGEDVAAATADLGAAELRPLVVRTSSGTVEVDIVIRQAPGPGLTVERGSVVQIVVSAGRLGAFGDSADEPSASAIRALGRGGFDGESDSGSITGRRPGTVSWVTASADMTASSTISPADGIPAGPQTPANGDNKNNRTIHNGNNR